MEGNASVYHVYPVVSRITGEGRAEFLRAWGPGFEQEGAGGGARKRAGQLNLCAETINLLTPRGLGSSQPAIRAARARAETVTKKLGPHSGAFLHPKKDFLCRSAALS